MAESALDTRHEEFFRLRCTRSTSHGEKILRNAVDEVLYAIKHKTTLASGLMQAFIYLVEHTFMHSQL